MKKSFSFLVLFLVLLSGASAQKNVQKSDATATRDEITGDLKFGTGRTGTFLTGAALTLNSGSTLTLNGALAGTPTGGTLSLANLTLTLPATVSGGGSSFQPIDSDLTAIAALTTTANGRGLLTASALTAAGLGLTNGATIDTIGAKTQSGTGNLVLATSPTLTTPTIDSITASGNTSLTLTGGTTGASLVLGSGATAGNATIAPTGTGVVAIAGTGSKLTIAGTTASTSTTTGSLINAGGFGNAGAAFFGGTVSIPYSTDGTPSLRFNSDSTIGIGSFEGASLRFSIGGTRRFLMANDSTLYGEGNAASLRLASTGTITFTPTGGTALTLTATTLAATFAGAVTHTLGTNLPPQTAPASPASGWTLYTDSGDGNKLKAKASTGTVVTIGTP